MDDISQGLKPIEEEGPKTRAAVTIILASSAAILALSSAITSVVRAVANRPQLSYRLIPVTDASGNPVLDSNGKPIFEKEPVLLETNKDTSNEVEAKFGELFIKWGSEETQSN